MQKSLRYAVFALVVAGLAPAAQAGELKLTLANGRATLIAQDVPVRQILAEWARVGKTTIVNGEKLTGPPISLQLVDRPEREVLELVLSSASGYIAAQREITLAGASVFDRVMILPTSKGPVGVAAAPPPSPAQFNRPGMAPPMPMPMPVPDEDEPQDTPLVPPGMGGPPAVGGPTAVGNPNMPNPNNNNPAAQPTLTSPRPGMLPAPPAGQPNPFGVTPVQPGPRPPGAPNGVPGFGPGVTDGREGQ
jgi:hypothetical protein